MSAPARTLVGAAAGIAVVTAAARVVGFGRTALLARTVEINCVSSTYVVANSVPNVIFEVVAGGALASLVVPVLAPAVAAGDRERVSRICSALLTWTVLVLVPVALVGLAVAPALIRALARSHPACGPRALGVGADMLRVFMPQVVLYGVAVVLTGVLQAHRRFLGPALAPMLSSLVVMTAYVVYALRGRTPLDRLPRSQELVLSVGTTLGVVILAGSLLVPLRSTGVRLRPALRFPPGLTRQIRRLAVAGLAGLLAQQLALVVALRLALQSRTAPTVFVLATAVFLLPWSVLALPVATSAFPALAAAVSTRDGQRYDAVARRAVRAVVVLAAVGTAVLVAVAVPVARLLQPQTAPEVSAAVRAFAPGLVGYSLLALLSRALYARGNSRTPAAATVAGWLVVVIADAALVLGTDMRVSVALGLGNAAGMTVAAALLLGGLHRASPGALAGLGRTAAASGGAASVAVGLALAVPTPAHGPLVNIAQGAGLALLVAGVYVALLRLADPLGFRTLHGGFGRAPVAADG